LIGRPEGRSYLEDSGTGGKIILKLILKKQCVRMLIGFIWLSRGSSDELF
jgi:hypothetical protein